MSTAIAFLLAATFLISVAGLGLLVWALANDQFTLGSKAPRVIFASHEEGRIDDPAADAAQRVEMQRERGDVDEADDEQADDLEARARADASTRGPVVWWLASSLFWLLFGSLLGLVASLKLHMPDWLVSDAVLTFGRIRPAHLNTVAYGWASMAGVGIGVWLIPRLFRVRLRGGAWVCQAHDLHTWVAASAPARRVGRAPRRPRRSRRTTLPGYFDSRK